MKYIDQENWPRRDIFKFFNAMDYPQFNVCGQAEIGPLYREAKRKGLSVSQSMMFVVCKAANMVPELRMRIRGDEVVEHEIVHPSMTVLNDENVFGFCEIEFSHEAGVFLKRAHEAIEAARKRPIYLGDAPGRDDYLFLSVLPWVRFSGTTHPIHMNPVDSVPRLTWGKHLKEGDSVTLPVAIQVHHAVADGYHVGRFFTLVEELAQDAKNLLAEV